MTLVVILFLAVVWAIVLGPMLLRKRAAQHADDSVVAFHRQLRVLRRTGPALVSPVNRLAQPSRAGISLLSPVRAAHDSSEDSVAYDRFDSLEEGSAGRLLHAVRDDTSWYEASHEEDHSSPPAGNPPLGNAGNADSYEPHVYQSAGSVGDYHVDDGPYGGSAVYNGRSVGRHAGTHAGTAVPRGLAAFRMRQRTLRRRRNALYGFSGGTLGCLLLGAVPHLQALLWLGVAGVFATGAYVAVLLHLRNLELEQARAASLPAASGRPGAYGPVSRQVGETDPPRYSSWAHVDERSRDYDPDGAFEQRVAAN